MNALVKSVTSIVASADDAIADLSSSGKRQQSWRKSPSSVETKSGDVILSPPQVSDNNIGAASSQPG